MSSTKSKFNLLLTRRALRDIQEIFDFFKERWVKQTAENYIDEMEASLERLKARPDLLRPEPDLHSALMFYRVSKHLLVCDLQRRSIVVLAVIHASRDNPSRLAELQPTLAAEVEMLHRKLRAGRSKRS